MTPTASTRNDLATRFASAFPRSRALAEQARDLFPDGVTHDLRRLEPFPVYVDRAEGSRKWTIEGRELIDYWAGHGALLLGHCHPAVVEGLVRQARRGTHPGACHEAEVEWGRWVCRLIRSAERVRFVGSGTEATLMALRLARLATGRPKVLKFAGHFHGWHDFLVPGADFPHHQAVPGVPHAVADLTVIVRPGDPEVVDSTLAADSEIGCVILEPTGGHWGQVPLGGDFLRALREITTRCGALLIFDEVITGFRVHPGGAQGLHGVTPDLTTLAKVLAGGLPGGAVAGRAEVMAFLQARPGKPKMKHPGTFNANPLSAAAGIATLEQVATGEPGRLASARAGELRRRLNELFAARGAPWLAYGAFSFVRLVPGYRGPRPAGDDFVPHGGDLEKLESPRKPALVQAFRQGMLLHGVDMIGLGAMVTSAHTPEDVERTVLAVEATLEVLREEGLDREN
jgi:glutamate-1-semialdehyde 2,1-aminomutase